MTNALGTIAPALLEDWFRDRYFAATTDISSSGVENWTLGRLRALLDIPIADLDAIAFRDSPSCGHEELTSAIRDRYPALPGHRIMVTHGSSEALFLALAALLRPGDEVVVPDPAYQSLVSTVEALGARPVPWELSPDHGFVPDLDRLARLLGPRTRLVVANFPHNPTGATLTRSAYDDFLGLMAGHPAHLLWDGALAELGHGGERLPDPAGILERCVSTGTYSKAFGLPGLRIGWCAAPAATVRDMVRLRDYTTLNSSPVNEFLAARVMRHADTVLAPRLRTVRRNRELLMTWAREHPRLVDCPPPAGGVTAFPAIRTVTDTRALCEHLAAERGVLAVPGDCFGHPDRVRIGFGGPTGELTTGLDALTAALTDMPAAV
ncbi:capreomycidine synthase [Streptomyces sp. NPDC057682]|uniref:capreomycidine synthase n=1 Tax=Streptomyces sp. NPDC057682 TaxID=3346210 RepID=UPI0036C7DB29